MKKAREVCHFYQFDYSIIRLETKKYTHSENSTYAVFSFEALILVEASNYSPLNTCKLIPKSCSDKSIKITLLSVNMLLETMENFVQMCNHSSKFTEKSVVFFIPI